MSTDSSAPSDALARLRASPREARWPVGATYPLSELPRAQQDFMSKRFAGKLVVIP